jgi:hypothetical protein
MDGNSVYCGFRKIEHKNFSANVAEFKEMENWEGRDWVIG